MTNLNKNSVFALLGLAGGVLYEIADFFIYLNSHLDKLNPDPAWTEMAAVRFLLSMIFAVFGSCLLFLGYVSNWRMLSQKGNSFEKVLGGMGIMGVVATVCGHFLLGCLKPLIFKGMVSAGCEAQYLPVSDFVDRYTCAVSWMAIIGIYLPHLASICCLLKGKLGISRWRLAEVLGLFAGITLISSGIFALFRIKGSLGACESLFEGLLCLIPFWYWKQNPAD